MTLSLTGPEDDAAREAAEWELRLSDPEVSDETFDAFDAWMAARPENAEAFANLQMALADLDAGADTVEVQRLRADAQAFADAPQPHIAATSSRFSAWRWGAIAAAVLLVLGPVTALVAGVENPFGAVSGSHTEGAPSVDVIAYATGTGEQRDVMLLDGSTLTLDTQSLVDVRFAAQARDLTLREGRAHFDVAHDAARPFIVEAGAYQVVATGTAFDVRLDAEAVTVTLMEGEVRIARNAGDAAALVTLQPGQQWVAPQTGAAFVRDVDVGAAGVWRSGRIVLDNTALGDAVQEFNRYLDAPIELADEDVMALTVSGQFRTRDASGFLDAVAALHGLEAQRLPDGSVRLTRSSRSDG